MISVNVFIDWNTIVDACRKADLFKSLKIEHIFQKLKKKVISFMFITVLFII